MRKIFTILGIIEIAILQGCKPTSPSPAVLNNFPQPSPSITIVTTPAPITPRRVFGREYNLLMLRRSLDLVREKEKDSNNNQPYESRYNADASVLIGLHKREIQKALGKPKICQDLTTAPCKIIGDWYYSFYSLPSNWIGGGQELVLHFDKQRKCKSIQWILTQ